jgi:hypothetical protein
MNMGVKCSDLTTMTDHGFLFMEEDQMRSKGWFRKFLEGLVQQRGQEHIPEVSGVTDDSFRSSREIVPEQCDEPLGSDVVLPLISDEFLENLWMRSCLLMNPLESVV